MAGYSKLFSSIVTSTIWTNESMPTRLVWVTMLALSDANGYVEGSIPGLAHQARVTVREVEQALCRLMAPDPYSRTKDMEGRRVVEVPGGWRLVNYATYRNRLQEKEGSRARTQRQYRQRLKDDSCNALHRVTNPEVTDGNALPRVTNPASASVPTRKK